MKKLIMAIILVLSIYVITGYGGVDIPSASVVKEFTAPTGQQLKGYQWTEQDGTQVSLVQTKTRYNWQRIYTYYLTKEKQLFLITNSPLKTKSGNYLVSAQFVNMGDATVTVADSLQFYDAGGKKVNYIDRGLPDTIGPGDRTDMIPLYVFSKPGKVEFKNKQQSLSVKF
ncbi:MAG: hypothetical protein ACYCX4_00315 [Bacillota bacterium]